MFRSNTAARDQICGICTAWVANPSTRTHVWMKGNANEHLNDERESEAENEWGTGPLCVHKALCNPYRWIGLFRSGGRIKEILLWHLRSAPLPLYEIFCQRSCLAHVSWKLAHTLKSLTRWTAFYRGVKSKSWGSQLMKGLRLLPNQQLKDRRKWWAQWRDIVDGLHVCVCQQ